MTETIILEVGGAIWDVLYTLLKTERLPEMESLIHEGHKGPSKVPSPHNSPVWLSMAIGQNPGKTGVFYSLAVNTQTRSSSNHSVPRGSRDRVSGT
jgi:predicted AlkP superfamily phosphohydrolase/phosphomutase